MSVELTDQIVHDVFAGLAMAGLMASGKVLGKGDIAGWANEQADAMMAERKKRMEAEG